MGALIVSLGVLASASGSARTDSWRSLHRALELPTVQPGQACPVSTADARVNWATTGVGEGFGRGPAYPILAPGAEAVGRISTDDGWFQAKVLWYVKPSYKGRVLVRGAQLDGTRELRFKESRRVSPELRINRDDTVSWAGQPDGSRGIPSYLVFRTPGCYGVQVDAAKSSRTVVLAVTLPN